MIRRAVAASSPGCSRLSMTAVWVWVIGVGRFMASMMAAVPAEEQASLTRQRWWSSPTSAMAGIAIVTIANSTVGLLLASRQGGGRMGAILLAAGLALAAVPVRLRGRGQSWRCATRSTRSRTRCSCIGPASYALRDTR